MHTKYAKFNAEAQRTKLEEIIWSPSELLSLLT